MHAVIKYIEIMLALAFALNASDGISVLQGKLPVSMSNFAGVGWGQIFGRMIGGVGPIFATQYVMQALVSTQDEKDRQARLLQQEALTRHSWM